MTSMFGEQQQARPLRPPGVAGDVEPGEGMGDPGDGASAIPIPSTGSRLSEISSLRGDLRPSRTWRFCDINAHMRLILGGWIKNEVSSA